MQICDYCFNDEEMQLAIRNESESIGVCDASGRESKVVDINFFLDFFHELLNLFEPRENGIDVVSLLQKDWNLFASDEIGNVIVKHFIEHLKLNYSIEDKVDYISSISNNLKTWNILKTQVKEKSRFFTNLSFFDDIQLMEHNTTIPSGTPLFRARVIPSGRNELGVDEMGCPPANITPAGRANPLGIPYLYLCQEEETCYYEVRALYLDKLAIGTFKVVNNLKILDFTKNLSLYFANTMSKDIVHEILKYKLLQNISKDLSKPLRRFDTEIEYVPTQFVCEYCKISGIDGIQFNSSLHKGGVNVVLFNSKSAECVAVNTIEIKQVTIEK